jgi:hypothetical protein
VQYRWIDAIDQPIVLSHDRLIDTQPIGRVAGQPVST